MVRKTIQEHNFEVVVGEGGWVRGWKMEDG